MITHTIGHTYAPDTTYTHDGQVQMLTFADPVLYDLVRFVIDEDSSCRYFSGDMIYAVDLASCELDHCRVYAAPIGTRVETPIRSTGLAIVNGHDVYVTNYHQYNKMTEVDSLLTREFVLTREEYMESIKSKGIECDQFINEEGVDLQRFFDCFNYFGLLYPEFYYSEWGFDILDGQFRVIWVQKNKCGAENEMDHFPLIRHIPVGSPKPIEVR